MGCAVCHDHKLDPITQKEFYQVFSIFNNISENAMDGNALLPPPMLKLPSPDQQQQLDDQARRITVLEKQMRDALASLKYIDPATLTNAPKPEAKEIVWMEDDFPPKAVPQVNEGNPPYQWVTTNEGTGLQRPAGPAAHRQGRPPGLFPGRRRTAHGRRGRQVSSLTFTWIPTDPPKRDHAAISTSAAIGPSAPTGATKMRSLTARKARTEKVQAGQLPKAGEWVRLEVEAARLDLRPGTKITGLAFTQFDGNAWWDKAGLVSVNDPAQNPDLSVSAWEKFERELGDESASARRDQRPAQEGARQARGRAERQKLRDHFLEQVYAGAGPELAATRSELEDHPREARGAGERNPGHHDLQGAGEAASGLGADPRPVRQARRSRSAPGVPAVLPPLPQGDVTNRLTFARWLVDPKHPLTARVTVNRFWQQFFGTGPREDERGLRHAGRVALPSRAAGLAGHRIHAHRLGREALVRLIVTSPPTARIRG